MIMLTLLQWLTRPIALTLTNTNQNFWNNPFAHVIGPEPGDPISTTIGTAFAYSGNPTTPGPPIGPTYTGFPGVTQLPPGYYNHPASQVTLHSSPTCRVTHGTRRSSGHCGASAHGHTHRVHLLVHHPHHHKANLPGGIEGQPF